MTPATEPLRIALSGKMRSGKDTAAKRLMKRHGFRRFAFADRIRDLASELFGVSPDKKNRALLIGLGRRMVELDKLVWVRYVVDRVPLSADVVVTDLRFPYEAHELRRLGFRLVRISVSRREQERRVLATDPGMDLALLDDKSETALDGWANWDYELDGSGYVKLNTGVDEMVQELRA